MPLTASSPHPLSGSPQPSPPAPGLRRTDPSAAVAMKAAEMTLRAHQAQRQFDGWAEERVDALLRDIAETISAASPVLAAEAVTETGIGNVADKITKKDPSS